MQVGGFLCMYVFLTRFHCTLSHFTLRYTTCPALLNAPTFCLPRMRHSQYFFMTKMIICVHKHIYSDMCEDTVDPIWCSSTSPFGLWLNNALFIKYLFLNYGPLTLHFSSISARLQEPLTLPLRLPSSQPLKFSKVNRALGGAATRLSFMSVTCESHRHCCEIKQLSRRFSGSNIL